jgi:uncharacterized membrane protein
MDGLLRFVKTTIVGGALWLVPITIVLVVLAKVHGLISKLLGPIVEALQLRDIGGVAASRLIAVVVLLLVCFLAGLLSKTAMAQRTVEWLERAILSNLPGYSMVHALGEQVTGHAHGGTELKPVLARIEDAWQLAMLVEAVDAEHLAVFVPGAPDPRSGSIYLLTKDRIKPVDISTRDAMKCIKGLGIGARSLLAGRL